MDRLLCHEGTPGLARGQGLHSEWEVGEAGTVIADAAIGRRIANGINHALLFKLFDESAAQSAYSILVEHLAEEPIPIPLPRSVQCGEVSDEVIVRLEFLRRKRSPDVRIRHRIHHFSHFALSR